jgi:hypothetical protein
VTLEARKQQSAMIKSCIVIQHMNQFISSEGLCSIDFATECLPGCSLLLLLSPSRCCPMSCLVLCPWECLPSSWVSSFVVVGLCAIIDFVRLTC